MNAVILAAGVGKRLRPFTAQHPKCLLRFGGSTLLGRHLHMFDRLNMEAIYVVTGHLADQVEAEVALSQTRVPVRLVHNPEYHRGSALSLLCAAPAYRGMPAVIMDADLLFGERLLERLLEAPFPNCLLVDERLTDTGEEIKVVAGPNGRVMELGKQVGFNGHLAGESVGVFKFSVEAGQNLGEELKQAVRADPETEYEPVINNVLRRIEVGYVAVSDLPWLEIDFAEDVERAQAEIWPEIVKSER